MPGSYMKALVKCPFYNGDDAKRRINCEGLLPGTYGSHYFPDNAAQARYLRRVCSQNYARCPYAAALLEKYKEEDANE